MRICHLVSVFSRTSESFIYDQIIEQEKQGVETYVVTRKVINRNLRPHSHIGVLKKPVFNPAWIKYKVISNIKNSFNSEQRWKILESEIKKEIRRIKPDVIHAHFGEYGFYLKSIVKELDIPFVVTFYGYDVSKLIYNNQEWRNRYKSLFDVTNSNIAISTHIYDKLIKLGASEKKTEIIHLGVDINKFIYHDPKNNFDGTTVKCLHVGRLVEKKSPSNLIKAFNVAQRKLTHNYRLHLDIVGDGPLRESVEQLINKFNISSTVTVHGAVAHKDVISYMKQANIYIQHCITATDGDEEGQGVTFVEASASGLPIISTIHNGIPDVVKHNETGFLVDEGDFKEMGEYLCLLSEKPDMWEKFGKAGRNRVIKKFKQSTQVRKIITLYEKLIK
jgi:glycosyltransferase involved in cell wall biosynthesis